VGGSSGTVTFLFTDIEGSTGLWEQDEEAMRAAVSRHDELLCHGVAEGGGTVFSTMGDGVAAVFASASAAVAAALVIQQRLVAEPWPTARPLRVRMGLHTGEAEERGGDYFGTAVNRAARLMAVGHGGQVLCSPITGALVDADVELIDLGEHRLRGLDRAMRILQVGPGTFPSLRSLDALPGNLPVQVTSFIGRDADLDAVAGELAEARLVTLTGAGGVGKTRLAMQVGAEVLASFPDGVWVCELAAAGNTDDLAQIVAIALGVVQRAQMTLLDSIIDVLRTRRLLMVLDNCEHLLDGAAALAGAVLASAPEVRILATSREGLGIPGERLWSVRSLSVESDVGGAEASEAALLFADRARAVARDFALDRGSAPGVVEVCRRLDGIPLAIELAAARVATMTPAEIAGHLDERFRLLTGGRRGRVERHQTLRAAIEWSYSLLGDTERVVFDRLGVFPGGFDEAAAIAVCVGDGVEGWDVIDALASLVAKSMVGAARSGDATRYQLLETLRHFARDRARDGGGLEGLRRRHAAHYAAFAEQAGAGLISPEELVWRPRLAAELDNLRVATGWAFDAVSLEDVRLGVRVIVGLVMEAGLQPSSRIQAWASAALDSVDRLTPAERSAILAAAAFEALYVGDFDRARTLGAPVIADRDTPTQVLLLAVTAVSVATAASGDPMSGMAVLADVERRLSRDGATDWVAGNIQCVACWLALMMGDAETTKAAARRAVVLARRAGAPSLLALALSSHARAMAQEDSEEALAAAEEAVRLVDSGAGDSGYGAALQTAAELRVLAGDTARAAEAVCKSIRHTIRIGSRVSMDSITIAVLLLAGDPDRHEAVATVGGALDAAEAGQFPSLLSASLSDRCNRAVIAASAALGGDRSAEARQHGAVMTYDEVLTYTLDQLALLIDTSGDHPPLFG